MHMKQALQRYSHILNADSHILNADNHYSSWQEVIFLYCLLTEMNFLVFSTQIKKRKREMGYFVICLESFSIFARNHLFTIC